MASGKPAGFSEEDGARMPSGEKDSVEKDGDSGDEQKPDVMTLLTAMMGKMNAHGRTSKEAEERAEVRTRELRVAMHEGWQAVQRESQPYTDEKLDIVKEELLGAVELVRRQAEEAATVALRGVTECRELVQEVHAGHTSGHQGVKKTLCRLRQRFYWFGPLRRDVIEWCRTCYTCAAKMGPPQRTRAPLQLYRAGAPMERVAVDIAGPSRAPSGQ
ncbi:hypothetical protein GWK47_029555 [Chionoecetes opilio]|uniref:Integrase zinc-binding domain-containing protein n=1 Tax=Chionoecetes opilio TaxID=41210 RepID=A0A8J4YKB1_CHIOP|nr:hypothetical protein GWK47_029555 [Chionoecetes opilio]